MKKFWLIVLLAAVLAGVGWLIYRFTQNSGNNSLPAPVSSASVFSAASSQAGPGAAPSASAEPSSAPSAAARKYEDFAKTAIDLDWNKYHLKAEKEKTVNGKAYQAFSIWGEDYSVGPTVLVDPADGKAYTWVASDSAPMPAAQDKAFDKTPHTITGIMEDGAMMSITLKTDDGAELMVRRVDVDTTDLKSMVIGDRIKVTYTGVIKGNDMSRAFVTKLENVK